MPPRDFINDMAQYPRETALQPGYREYMRRPEPAPEEARLGMAGDVRRSFEMAAERTADPVEAAMGFMPAGITREAGMKWLGRFLKKRRRLTKQPFEAALKEQRKLKQAAEEIPENLWEHIRGMAESYESQPVGRYYRALKAPELSLYGEEIPRTFIHELGGHAAFQKILEDALPGTNLSRFLGQVSKLDDEAIQLQKKFGEMAAKYDEESSVARGLKGLGFMAYLDSPEEILSRALPELRAQGMTLEQATRTAYKRLLKKLPEIRKRIRKHESSYQEWTRLRAGVGG